MSRVAPTVLFLHNEHLATEGLLGEAFADAGFDIATFTVVPPELIDTPAHQVVFPDPLNYDVIVPLGARWPVYDEALRATWVGAEMALMRDAAAAGVALLGVCFGGQLLAQAFGGSVGRSPAPEIGWYDIATDRPDLVPPGPWFQWHFDRWTPPPGAVEIARSANASQAFVLGRALALQFHPELDTRLLAGWLGGDQDGEVARFGHTHDELLARTAALQDDAARRIRDLVAGFLSYVSAAPCPS
jgi:GMP synthase-like glutamine amidotransferase